MAQDNHAVSHGSSAGRTFQYGRQAGRRLGNREPWLWKIPVVGGLALLFSLFGLGVVWLLFCLYAVLAGGSKFLADHANAVLPLLRLGAFLGFLLGLLLGISKANLKQGNQTNTLASLLTKRFGAGRSPRALFMAVMILCLGIAAIVRAEFPLRRGTLHGWVAIAAGALMVLFSYALLRLFFPKKQGGKYLNVVLFIAAIIVAATMVVLRQRGVLP